MMIKSGAPHLTRRGSLVAVIPAVETFHQFFECGAMGMLGGIAGSIGFFDFLEIVGDSGHVITCTLFEKDEYL